MSDIDLGEQKEKDWENWLDENDYVHLGGEFYECSGNHTWHVSDLAELYEKTLQES